MDPKKHLKIALYFLLFISVQIRAQIGHKPSPIQCQLNPETYVCYVAPPVAFLNQEMEVRSDFIFTFDPSVPLVAKQAMEYAASIWASRLFSLVPIEIAVTWDTFEEETVLASAGPTTIYRDFKGAPKRNTWYPVALAEAIAGTNFNDDEPDIQIIANSTQSWYYGLDGKVPRGKIDMVSVILHELGHGLGFLSSAEVNDDDLGAIGFGSQNIIFDEFIETSTGSRVTDQLQFTNPSTGLRTAYTSNALLFADENTAIYNNGQFPKLFAPRTFDQGSSVSHLDEITFRSGSESALMSPSLSFQEAIHDPGPVGLAIMQSIGWDVFWGTVTSTSDLVAETLEVYPNPAIDVIQIKWPADLDASLNFQLYDQLGRVLLNGSINRQESLDVSNLTSGTYFLQLHSGPRNFVSQIIVAR